ncbi:MAG: hypothetical protein HQK53_17785, partial [Oligoflexia bacterium]|nr:hypothetical protein [Oligoflexia bacterium]
KIVPVSKKIKNDFIQTFRIVASKNEAALKEAALTDGILVYVTNHVESSAGMFTLHANQIARHYREKYVIENAFRFLKSFLDLRPMYVWVEEHVKAHVDICMIGCFLSKYIDIQLEDLEMCVTEFYALLNRYSKASSLSTGANDGRLITVLEKIPNRLKNVVAKLGIDHIFADDYLKKFGLKI